MVITDSTYRTALKRAIRKMAKEWAQQNRALITSLADRIDEGYHGTLYATESEYDAWMLWEALTSSGYRVWIARGFSGGKAGDMTGKMEIIA